MVEEDAARPDDLDDQGADRVALFQAQNLSGVDQLHDGNTLTDVGMPDRFLDAERGELGALDDLSLGLSNRGRNRRGRSRRGSDRCNLDRCG